MHYTTLGKSTLQISRIGFGCMSLEQKLLSENLLQKAIAAGVNYFDTADLYDKGMNEELVGKTLKEYRKQVIIATKVGNVWRADGSGWDWNAGKAYILKAVDASLKRLQTDYIDLYQLHGGTLDDPIDETIEAFELLVQQGKIRYYGLSSIRPNVIQQWVKRSNITSVMLQYSLLDRRAEESVLPLLVQNSIGVLARGSVAQGLLINKPPKQYLDYTAEQVQKAAALVNKLSNKHRTAVQTALQFVLQNEKITSAVVGIRNFEHLEAAIGAINNNLSVEEKKQLLSVLPANLYKEHR